MKAETIMSRMRIFRSILAVIIAVLVLRPVPTYSSQDATMITALAVDPLTPTTLYAGTQGGGVFKSTDGGANWNSTNLTNVIISALAINPQAPTILYAGTNSSGVLKSADGGKTWTSTGLTVVGVLSLAIDPKTPTTLYAGTNGGAVFTSTDEGVSWSSAALFLYGSCSPCGGVSALAIDPVIPTTLFAGTGIITAYDYDGSYLYSASGRVFNSTDGGTSWAMSAWLNDYESAQTLAIAPHTDLQTAVTLFTGTTLGVLKSTDGGVSWNATGLTGVGVLSLVIDPLTPTTLYAGTSGGVFKSSDGGSNWSSTGLTGIGDVLTLAIDPLTPTTLYAGTGTSGVYKSTNSGGNWSPTGSITWPHNISSISVNPTSVVGGSPSTGTVSLSAAAPTGGAVIALGSDPWNVATVPTTVTVPAGATTADFNVSTSPVTGSIEATIWGLYGGASTSAVLTVTAPSLVSFTLNPALVTGGAASTGTVILSMAAPAGGTVVTLFSGNPFVATVPVSVTVPAGATSVNFTVSTSSVTASNWVTIWAANYSAVLTVTPPTTLSLLSLNPTSVIGGSSSTGTVTLNAAAPAGGVTIPLSSSDPAVATVPVSVTVPAGATSANFTVYTNSVTTSTSVTIFAANYSVVLNVSPPGLSSLSLNPTSVTGGTASTGTVTLSGSAPAGGGTVALSSSNSAVATVPASVTVPAGAANASFTVFTTACTSGAVTISGTYGGVTKSAGLTVTTTPDTLTIQQADYFANRRELRVAVKDTNSTATLQVYVTSTGQLIGQLTKGGDGTYRGQFTWPTNPQNITAQSSLCGRSTKDVASK